MADGKKKRSLREAFGVARPPEGTIADGEAATGGTSAKPLGAPEGAKPAPTTGEEGQKKASARNESRSGSRSRGSNGESRTGRRSKDGGGTGVPVITGQKAETPSRGREREASEDEGRREEVEEMVPGRGGKMVSAGTPVNMTFTVTAKERYLWTLELKRRGLTAVGVLRETMEAMLGENDR